MADAYEEAPRVVRSGRGLDTGLNVVVTVLVVAVVALAAFFGYTVWRDRQSQELTNAPARVIRSLKTQVRQAPNDVILRVRLGEALGAAGLYSESIEQLNAALKLDPKHIGAHLDLGMVAMLTENDDEAVEYFKKVVALTEEAQYAKVDQRRELALYNLGQITLRQQKYEAAAGYFKAALRIRKDASDTYLNLARALRGLEDYDSAIQNLEYALSFDPGFAEAHYTLGQVYEQKGDKVNASYYYYQAARLEPDAELPQEAIASFGPPSEWVARAESQLSEGAPDDALDSALIATNLDPKNVDAIKVHAKVLVATEQFRDALEVLRRGLTVAKNDVEIKASIAQIEDERPRDALAVYQKALKSDPDNAELKAAVVRLNKAGK